MSRPRIVLVAPLLLSAACSSTEPTASPTAPSPIADPGVHPALDRALVPLESLGVPLGRGGRLAPIASGARGFHAVARPGLEATLPARADGALRVSAGGDAWIEIEPTGARPVVGRPVEGAIAYERAAPDTDVVLVVDGGRVEELRVLRGPAAAPDSRARLRLGPGLAAARVRGGRVEVIDAAGHVRLASAPIYAVDARGVRRDGTTSLVGGESTAGGGARTYALATTIDVTGLAYPIAVDPAWSTPGTMIAGRNGQFAVKLASGKVLLGGGSSGPDVTSSVELWDPTSNTWTVAASMGSPRYGANAVLLPTGKVMVLGGAPTPGWTGTYSTTELYDPASASWTPGPAMASPRTAFGAVAIAGGVFVVGGQGGVSASSACELYDPTANAFVPKAALLEPRWNQSTVALSSGKVLIAGGYDDTGHIIPGGEVYDPGADAWKATRPMLMGRTGGALASIGGDRAMVLGGTGAADLSSAELFDVATNAWSALPAMGAVRSYATAVVLPGVGASGKVLAVGSGMSAAEIFDVATKTWSPAGVASDRRWQPAAIALDGARALIAAGGPPSSEIYAAQALGAPCTVAGECASGACVDGVCCDSLCAGSCTACDVASHVGTCSPVDGAAPHGARSCGAFARCVTGACLGVCTATSDCASDRYCVSGSCVPRRVNGLACVAASDCQSGNCVDGVCCDAPCGDQCAACDVPGAFGTCTPTVGAPHGSRAACVGVAPGATCGIQCNGVDTTKCNYPTASTACGADACTAGIERRASACNGAGLCTDTSKSCGAYACGATACKVSCAGNSDCGAGYYCKGSACVPIEGLGTACTSGATCVSGACVDGVCCASSSCATGSVCNGKGKAGRCALLDGASCSVSDECASGSCVDGVCCESACAGQCEACDVAGSKGRCVAVAGKPHGARVACDDGGASPCKALACDGATDRTKCTAFAAGTSVSCAAPTCNGGSFSEASTCDGNGACLTPTTTSCLPFSCSAKGCFTSCTNDAECADGYQCRAPSCVAKAASCAADLLSSVPSGGQAISCAPYRCDQTSGDCRRDCQTSDDCAPGSTCDTASKLCARVEASSDGGGGCALSGRGRGRTSGGAGLSAVLVLAGVWWTRRRRAHGAAAALACVAAAGCSSGGRDLGAAAEEGAVAGRTPVLAALRAMRVMPAARDAGASLTPSSEGWSMTARGASKLAAALPGRADGALRLSAPGEEGVWIEIRATDLRPIAGRVDEGAVVYAGAHENGAADVVLSAEPGRVEELRWLKLPRARATARYEISLGPSLRAMTVDHGRVRAMDGRGRVRFESARVVAVDARGERRDGTVGLRELSPARWALSVDVPLDGLAFPVAVDPAWSAGGVMSTGRRDHAAVALSNGKVLVAGGNAGATMLSTAELYDPATNAFTDAASLPYQAPLMRGVAIGSRALISGDGGTYVYEPSTDTWKSIPGGSNASLVTLADGRVLLGCGSLSSFAEIFDPATDTSTYVAPPPTPRRSGSATLLASGKVLCAGGEGFPSGLAQSSAEIYDPASDTWTVAAPLPVTRRFHVGARLPSGKVMVVGGNDEMSVDLSQVDVYDPATNAWSQVAPVPYVNYAPGGAVLLSGRVLYAGSAVGTAVYDEASDAWLDAGVVPLKRFFMGVSRLANGSVLVTGGDSNGLLLATSDLYTPIANGGSCDLAGECGSGICFAGRCCDTACAGPCQACDVAGKEGTCTALTGAPHYGRTCGGFACGAGTCKATCGGDADCVSTHYCLSNACVPKKTAGAACAGAGQCASGFCVDGVCCDGACGDRCAACDVAGHVGACWPVLGTPHGARPACTGPGLGTVCGPACDGKDTTKCTFGKSTTACSATACASGIETHASFCDGAGACKDSPASCGAYACGPTACRVTCSGDGDCAAGYYCKGSSCQPIEGLGTACTHAAACATGFCVDGVCCGVAACPGGSTCASPSKKGSCMKSAGSACSLAAECGTGFCVDGVCCDRACDGQCEACDVDGARGTCQGVTGAPHGARTACDDGGGDACKAKACAGATDATRCVAFVAGPTTTCGVSTCAAASFTAAPTCDGAGSCKAKAASSCVPYVCDATGCLSACTNDGHCSDGNECFGGKCVPKGAHCKDEVTSLSIDKVETTCTPYRCGALGTCVSACASSDDCAPGLICTVETKKCEEATITSSTDTGGCDAAGRGGAGAGAGASWLAAGVGLAAVVTARRRRSGRR